MGIGRLRMGRTQGVLVRGALLGKVGRGRGELGLEQQLSRMRRIQLALDLIGACDSFASGGACLSSPPFSRTLRLCTGGPLALQFHSYPAISGISTLNGSRHLLSSVCPLGGQFRFQLLNSVMAGDRGNANLVNTRFLGCVVA